MVTFLRGGVKLALGDGIGPGQDDGGGGLDLVVVELSEVLHIDLHLPGVGHGNGVAQGDVLAGDLVHRADDVGELAHAGRFNENPVGMVLLDDLGQGLTEIAHQRAADTAGVHLRNVDPGILKEAAVDADLTELILDEHKLLALVGFADHLFNQGGLARPQETGVNINLCHKNTF